MEEQADSPTGGSPHQDDSGHGAADVSDAEVDAAGRGTSHGPVGTLDPDSDTSGGGGSRPAAEDSGSGAGGEHRGEHGAERRSSTRRRVLLAAGSGVVVAGGVTVAALALRGKSGAPSPAGPDGGPKAAAHMVPADGATGVDPSRPVTVSVHGGKIASVSLTGPTRPEGVLSADGGTWTCTTPLHVDSDYRLSVTSQNAAGERTVSTSSFKTLKPTASVTVAAAAPPHGSTVGVGQPIRVTFSGDVPAEYRAQLEQACVVTTEPPVVGAWYWVADGLGGAVMDWRPQNFWPVGTNVTVAFNLNGVRLGDQQFGVTDYPPHQFTVSDTDLRLVIDKDKFQATCYQNGKVIRTFPIDTGVDDPQFVTYTGTMAVLGKGNPVEMKGNYGGGDVYDEFVNWATQITSSGTYIHAAPWDGEIGYANDDSHGCIHCRTADAEWFYGIVNTGDVVTVTGGRQRPVDVANGMCTFSLDWPAVLNGSAFGATINGLPVPPQHFGDRYE